MIFFTSKKIVTPYKLIHHGKRLNISLVPNDQKMVKIPTLDSSVSQKGCVSSENEGITLRANKWQINFGQPELLSKQERKSIEMTVTHWPNQHLFTTIQLHNILCTVLKPVKPMFMFASICSNTPNFSQFCSLFLCSDPWLSQSCLDFCPSLSALLPKILSNLFRLASSSRHDFFKHKIGALSPRRGFCMVKCQPIRSSLFVYWGFRAHRLLWSFCAHL